MLHHGIILLKEVNLLIPHDKTLFILLNHIKHLKLNRIGSA